MTGKDYMYKGEPVSTFYYNTGNGDRRAFAEFKENGRTYAKFGDLQAVGFYGEAYKMWDSDLKKYVLKVFVGMTKQHPNDKFNKAAALEAAHENCLMNPVIVMTWPKMIIRRFEFINMVKNYLAVMKLEFVKTKQEKEIDAAINRDFFYDCCCCDYDERE